MSKIGKPAASRAYELRRTHDLTNLVLLAVNDQDKPGPTASLPHARHERISSEANQDR